MSEKITYLRKSKYLDDWYILDKPGAIPEGSSNEWQEIINGIEMGMPRLNDFRRVAFERNDQQGVVEFYSPRNSLCMWDSVTLPYEFISDWITKAKQTLNIT